MEDVKNKIDEKNGDDLSRKKERLMIDLLVENPKIFTNLVQLEYYG